tara:strand:+ start:4656 stop:5732 length:1077 start_codon:yes stop_codon:yes gene_type:complete
MTDENFLVMEKSIPVPEGAKTRVTTDLDFDLEGKQISYLRIPYSRNTSAWGRLLIPIVQFKNGDGPTMFISGGIHGDEFEGPVVLIKLIQRLKLENVQGRIIIMPAVNLPAHLQSTRLSPIDNVDLNRCFPGSKTGSVTQVLAHYINDFIVPKADYVLDMHSGGTSLDFAPCVVMHQLEDKEIEAKTLAAVRAYGAPFALYLKEGDPDGLLDTAVEKAKKVFLSTELRGGATVTKDAVDIADNGLCNLLNHFGVAKANRSKYTRYKNKTTTTLLRTADESCFITAEDDGLFEPLVNLGDRVKAGQPIGQLHHITTPARRPFLLKANSDGVFICRRVQGRAEAGDCLAVIATEEEWEDL